MSNLNDVLNISKIVNKYSFCHHKNNLILFPCQKLPLHAYGVCKQIGGFSFCKFENAEKSNGVQVRFNEK